MKLPLGPRLFKRLRGPTLVGPFHVPGGASHFDFLGKVKNPLRLGKGLPRGSPSCDSYWGVVTPMRPKVPRYQSALPTVHVGLTDRRPRVGERHESRQEGPRRVGSSHGAPPSVAPYTPAMMRSAVRPTSRSKRPSLSGTDQASHNRS